MPDVRVTLSRPRRGGNTPGSVRPTAEASGRRAAARTTSTLSKRIGACGYRGAGVRSLRRDIPECLVGLRSLLRAQSRFKSGRATTLTVPEWLALALLLGCSADPIAEFHAEVARFEAAECVGEPSDIRSRCNGCAVENVIQTNYCVYGEWRGACRCE